MKVKIYALLLMMYAMAEPCSAQHRVSQTQASAAYEKAEKEDIAYVRSIDVHRLDSSLPSQRVEDWLSSVSPHIDVNWRLDDTCDLRPDEVSDYPRCVRITFRRGPQNGYFLVLIGTLKKGIVGPPHLYYGIGVEEGFVGTGSSERLSDLPRLLAQPVVTVGVNDLYQKIVERHPIGIPTGGDKTALWPYLSQRLKLQLENGQACQDDYFRRKGREGTGPKPLWLDIGIFAGHGKRALPLSAFASHVEPEKDGVYEVSVSLTYVKLPGFVPDEASWAVVARVVPEGNRMLIDDIRLFDGLDTNGPSHLLSESLAGCNGGRWTGEHVDNKPPAALPPPHYTDWNAVNVLRNAAFKEEVAFAKALDVHQIDPSLSSQHLEDWLKSSSLHLNHIEWHALGCNIKEGRYGAVREQEGRLCAGASFQRGNARGRIEISTLSTGTPGPPKLKYLEVRDKDDGLLRPLESTQTVPDSNRLSDLSRLLDEEAAIDATRNLYEAVVTRHARGISNRQVTVGTRPLLSKRLRGLLETAQVCQADYGRQHPRSPNLTVPPWFKDGLFAGEGELGVANAAVVDRKSRQPDGSFLVFVWLSRRNAALSDTLMSAKGWRTWHVAASVKSEGGNFVIDDVRLFRDDFGDGPSRLLSESFTGCDGRRWVGIGSVTN